MTKSRKLSNRWRQSRKKNNMKRIISKNKMKNYSRNLTKNKKRNFKVTKKNIQRGGDSFEHKLEDEYKQKGHKFKPQFIVAMKEKINMILNDAESSSEVFGSKYGYEKTNIEFAEIIIKALNKANEDYSDQFPFEGTFSKFFGRGDASSSKGLPLLIVSLSDRRKETKKKIRKTTAEQNL